MENRFNYMYSLNIMLVNVLGILNEYIYCFIYKTLRWKSSVHIATEEHRPTFYCSHSNRKEKGEVSLSWLFYL